MTFHCQYEARRRLAPMGCRAAFDRESRISTMRSSMTLIGKKAVAGFGLIFLWMLFPAFAVINNANAQISADEPLYCQPNEGDTFTISSGGTFTIDPDCGASAIVSGPSNGTLTNIAPGVWTYITNNAQFSGTDTFVVSVSSSVGGGGPEGDFGGGGGNEIITLNVVLLSQTITFTSAPPNPGRFGGTYTPAATGGASGNPVAFTIDASSTPGACSLSGGVVSFNGTGTCLVDANQAGGGGYSAAPQVQQSITIIQASQTITFTSAPPNPSRVGGTYNSAATGGASGKPVIFTIDASSTPGACSLSGGVVSFTGAGTCLVDANQAGNTNYSAAPQVSQTVNVLPATSTTTLAVSSSAAPANPSLFGQSVTFSATISSANTAASGTVAFTDSSSALTGCSAVSVSGGQAQCQTASLTVGSHAITATYSGDGNTTGSASSPALEQTVTQAATTTTIPPPSAISLGGTLSVPVSVTANAPGAGTPTGQVTVSDGSASCIVTLSNGSGSCTLTPPAPAGSQTLSAVYTATTNFATSTGTASLTVNAAPAGTVVTSSANPSVFGQSVTLTATVTPTSGNPTPTGNVMFTDGSANLCTSVALTNGTATCMTSNFEVGSHTIQASYAGDTNTAASGGTLALSVNQAATTLKITPPAPITLGQSATVTASVAVTSPGAGTPTGSIVISDGGSGSGDTCTITLPTPSCSLTPSSAGTATLTAAYSGDSDFVTSTGTASLSVGTTTSSITLTSSPNPSTAGQAVTLTATVSTVTPTPASVGTKFTASAGLGEPSKPHAMFPESGMINRAPVSGIATVPTGSVTFSDGGAVLATVALNAYGVATYSTAALTAGSHTISASYSGDANDSVATITDVQQVNPAVAPTPAQPAPTLSIWMLALLGLTLACAGMRYALERTMR